MFLVFWLTSVRTRTKRHSNIGDVRKKSKQFPPPYPNSWYFVDVSTNIERGKAYPLSALGREMVVFRTQEGLVGVLHAFCPHMGTHIGHGGSVVGDCVVCPYHCWKFGIDGKCTEIPYGRGVISERCNTKAYPVLESHGMVFMWYHADSEPPTGQIALLDSIDDSYRSLGHRWFDEMQMHVFEPSQNSADYEHFKTVHRYLANPVYDELIEVNHSVTSSYDNPHNQIIIEEQVTRLRFLGVQLPQLLCSLLSTTVVIETPSLVMFKIDNPVLGRFRGIFALTPVKPFLQRSVLTTFSDGIFWWFFGSFLSYLIVQTVHQDKPIWDHKLHVAPRNWVHGDGPFAAYSKWLQGFYSKSSSEDASLEW